MVQKEQKVAIKLHEICTRGKRIQMNCSGWYFTMEETQRLWEFNGSTLSSQISQQSHNDSHHHQSYNQGDLENLEIPKLS